MCRRSWAVQQRWCRTHFSQPGWVLTAQNGQVQQYNAGAVHPGYGNKYTKLIYSTRNPFNVGLDNGQPSLDSTICLSEDGMRGQREEVQVFASNQSWLRSRYAIQVNNHIGNTTAIVKYDLGYFSQPPITFDTHHGADELRAAQDVHRTGARWLRNAHIDLRTRPDLMALQLQQRIAELEIEKQRGQYHPVIRAEGTYLKRRSGFPSDQLSSVSVNATWTVFEGGRISAEIATARSQLRQIEQRRELLQREIEQEVRAAVIKLRASAERMKARSMIVEQARGKMEVSQGRFALGLATNLDIIDAQEDLLDAETDLLQAVVDYNIGIAELEASIAGSL